LRDARPGLSPAEANPLAGAGIELPISLGVGTARNAPGKQPGQGVDVYECGEIGIDGGSPYMPSGYVLRGIARAWAMLAWQRQLFMRSRGGILDKLTIFGFLAIATTLEASGDAIVRIGLGQPGLTPRILLFLAGAILLFGYGLFLNLAPTEFGKVVGLYIATLFVVWQIVNFVAFRSVPTLPILLGGALIIAGGSIVTFWEG
jgi:small multidrug resistance family-3 protein